MVSLTSPAATQRGSSTQVGLKCVKKVMMNWGEMSSHCKQLECSLMLLNKLRWNNSSPLFCVTHTKFCPISAADIYFRREAEVDRPHDSCFCRDKTKSPASTSTTVEHTLFFLCIIRPAYQKKWLIVPIVSSEPVFRLLLSLPLTCVTSSPCPTRSQWLRVDCSSGSPRSCCLSIIRGCHGNVGTGKNGEALVAGMNEWFSDDVLVWHDAPHRGGNACRHKDGPIIKETAETVAATPNHSVRCCEWTPGTPAVLPDVHSGSVCRNRKKPLHGFLF